MTAVDSETATWRRQWAEYYLARGWLVVPWKAVLAPDGQQRELPLAPPGNTYDSSKDLISRWQDDWQVGLVMSDTVALDFGSIDQAEAFYQQYPVPPGLVSWTGREGGGFHVICRRGNVDPGPQSSWGGDFTKLVVKTAGSFVPVYPSLDPSGHRYEWGTDTDPAALPSPHDLPVADALFSLRPARAARSDQEGRARYQGRLVDGSAILDEPEGVESVWGEKSDVLWASGEGLMIVGHQGLGKTTIAQQLAMAQAGIRPPGALEFPVRPLPPDRKVLYLAMDRPRQAFRSARRMLGEEDRAALAERLAIWKGPLPIASRILAEPEILADFIQKICPEAGAVYADSVKDFLPGVSKDEVGSALNSAWQEIIARGMELCLLHHQRKAGQGSERPNTLDDVYGSGWLTAGLGSVIALDGTPGSDRVTALHIKQPADKAPDMVLRHERRIGLTTRVVATSTVLEVLRRLGTATAAQIATDLYGESGGAEIKRVQRELSRLQGEELATSKSGGKNAHGGNNPARWSLTDAVAAVSS